MKFLQLVTLFVALEATTARISDPAQAQEQGERELQRLRTSRTSVTTSTSTTATDSPIQTLAIVVTKPPSKAPTSAPTHFPTGVPSSLPTMAPKVCEEPNEWVIDHDKAQSHDELKIEVLLQEGSGNGHFLVNIKGPPYAPTEDDVVSIPAWCIDYTRPIAEANYTMDVFSAFDPDVHSDAVDKPERLPMLAYMINHFNVGDMYDTPDENGEECKGEVTWRDYQGAVWYVIDFEQGQDNGFYNGVGEYSRQECISKGIAAKVVAWADENGDYEPDCTNPYEQIPLMYVVDEGPDDTIMNQVLMSETSIHSIEGMCVCKEPRSIEETVSPKTPAPTPQDDPMTPTSPPGTQGDPHFKTHSGETYDFHGGCDLVLIDNPDFLDGLGMLIHIRTKIETWWSYVESSVIRIGEETLEINGGGKDGWLIINGKPVSQLEDKKWYLDRVMGLKIRYRRNGINGEAHLYFGNSKSEKLELRTYKDFVKVEVAAHGSDYYLGSHGLLGRYPDGKRVGRDGETFIEDVNAFGQEWQVRPEEPKLFHSYDDAWVVPAGQQCAMPDNSATKQALRRRRLANGIPMEDAEKACAHLEDPSDRQSCVYDVVATQDVDMAGAW